MRARSVWALVAVTVASVAVALSPAGAVPPGAHARLNGSSPAPGSVVIEAPAEVVLTFNRDIAPPASVAVTGPSGDRVGTADPAVHGAVVSVPVTARDQGTYTVGYRAVSVDGHPITGSFVFSVGHRSAATGAAVQHSGRSASWVPAAVGLAALLAGLWSWRRRRRRSG